MRIAIIGGSIGGLTAGVLLRDAGYEVDIYERTPGLLHGYGTGIVVQPEIVRYFLERTEITLDQISVPSRAIQYFDAADGTLRGQVDADWRYTSYGALYSGLIKSYGLDRYHLGEALVGIDQTDDEVELRFCTGRVVRCDLAVCADGSFSTARQRLLGIVPQYAGYITWRGTAGRDRLTPSTWDFFDEVFTYGLLEDAHIIAYPMPILDESDLKVADRQINFQWYWNLPEGTELDEIMSDCDGIRRPVSVHHHAMQQRYLDEFGDRARKRLSPLFAELMTSAKEPFVTVIADTDVPRMALGRICLIGDAAVTGRPHAAAGAAKAANNAWTLVDAITEADGDVRDALRRWEPRQLEQGYALLAKVRRMGNTLQSGGEWTPGDPANRFGLPQP